MYNSFIIFFFIFFDHWRPLKDPYQLQMFQYLLFLFFSFSFQFSFVDEINKVPDPVIDVPISIVFFGNHPIVSPKVIKTDFANKWFKNLGHVIQQKVKKSSQYYFSSQEIKYPPIRYKFNFNVFNISEKDNQALENVFLYVSRPGSQFIKEDFKIIHPYSIQDLFDSFIEYYKIKGYVFFVYANNQTQFQFCEGISYNEYISIVENRSDYETEIKYYRYGHEHPIGSFDRKLSWSAHINNLLNKSNPNEGFGNWSTAESVYKNMIGYDDLKNELNNLSTINQCYPYWVISSHDSDSRYRSSRSFFMDVSTFAQSSITGESNEDSPTISEKMQDAIHSFESICNAQRSVNIDYCMKLEKYITDLRAEMVAFGSKKSYQSLERFLSNASSIILDALKTQIAPTIPSYDIELPDTFHISFMTIGKKPEYFKHIDFNRMFDDYSIGRTKTNLQQESAKLIEWPMIVLPLFNASYIFQTYNDYFNFTNLSRHKYLYDLMNIQYISAESLREPLQYKTVNPKLYKSENNEVVRDVVSIIVFPENNKVFQPILINGNTDSFAFDLVSLSIANNIDDEFLQNSKDTKTNQETHVFDDNGLSYKLDSLYVYNYDFRPNSVIRSTLIHMYGLTPSKRWRSLSIMCPFSQHATLNQVSRDVAYRNSVWFELGKTKTRINKHSTRVIKLLKLARQLTADSTTKRAAVAFSEDALISMAVDLRIQMDEVLRYASELNFEEMLEAVKHLRSKRKLLTNKLKNVSAELELQLCEYAPAHLIVKEQSILDKTDKLAALLFPIWITVLSASVFGAIYVFTNRMKLN